MYFSKETIHLGCFSFNFSIFNRVIFQNSGPLTLQLVTSFRFSVIFSKFNKSEWWNLLGLFHGAILQSGSPLSSFSFMGDVSARAYAIDLASTIDSSIDFSNDTQLLVDFLLNATARQIDHASTMTTVTVCTNNALSLKLRYYLQK